MPDPIATVLISVVVAPCPIAIPPLLSLISEPGTCTTLTVAPRPIAIPAKVLPSSVSPLPTDAPVPIEIL